MPEQKNAQFRFETITFLSKTLNTPPSEFKGRSDVIHDISVDVKTDPADEVVGVFVSAFLKTKEGIELSKVEIICGFKIENFKDIISESSTGDFTIPQGLQQIFVSASVSTLRGILYSHLQGTYLTNVIMPLIFFKDAVNDTPPEKIANQLLG